MSRLILALRSLVYGAIFLGFWAWLALRCRALDPMLGLELAPGFRPAGGILMALGGILALVSAGSFVLEGDGTPAPFDPPREFVVAGPYRWVRNPMYIGGMLLLAGFALWHHSGSMVAFAFLWGGLAHAFVMFYEEPRLEEQFGERYREYRDRVNRWLPTPP